MLYSDYVLGQYVRRYGDIDHMTPAQLKRVIKETNKASKLDRFFA